MFNIGDLVCQKPTKNYVFWGDLGVIVGIADRTAGPDNPKVYAYQIHFAKVVEHGYSDSVLTRWLLEQDIELVSEAKINV